VPDQLYSRIVLQNMGESGRRGIASATPMTEPQRLYLGMQRAAEKGIGILVPGIMSDAGDTIAAWQNLFTGETEHNMFTGKPMDGVDAWDARFGSAGMAALTYLTGSTSRFVPQNLALRWKPHPGFQMPAADKGRFLSELGNSSFALSDDAATAMMLPRGTSIPWREGIPDFGDHVIPGPAGIPGTFNVSGLTGAHAADRTLMLQSIASQSGISQRAVQQWLSANNARLHHSGGEAVQIVPARIHGLHHSGGAQQLRGGN
jgi:hypothetical protein